MAMVHAYSVPESRCKLSKTRAPGAVPPFGASAPDLLTSTTRESSPTTAEFSDTSQSYYSLRQHGISVRDEPDTDEADAIEVGKSLRKRFSRSATTISKRTSMRMPLGLSKSLIFRNEDTEREYEREKDIDDARRRAFREHLAAMGQSSEGALEEEDGYQERVMSPIRRQSFFTPGLATRNPTDKLAKPPKPVRKPVPETEYYYNPGCSPFSPLERIAALDLAERPESLVFRASTPDDLDYGRMGRLQITNGMASPTGSSRSALPRASVALRNSLDQGEIPPLSLLENHTSQTLLQNLLQTGYFRDSWAGDTKLQDEGSRDAKPVNHVGTSGLSSAWFPSEDEVDSVPDEPEPEFHSIRESQDATTRIAEDYMLGLADNPFEETGRSSSAQGFQPTTKPSEVDADLFDEDSVKRQSTWETDYVLPDVFDDGDDFEKRTSTLLAQIGFPTSSLAEAMLGIDIDYTALSKADSGYSSGSSVISIEKKAVSPKNANPKRQGTVASRLPPIVVKAKKRPTPVTIQSSTTIRTAPFSNSMQTSTETLNTAATTISFGIESPRVASPRKLQKSRPRSQPPPSNRCTIQMHLDVDPYITPGIPNELAARVAQRLAEVPPLNHTLPSIDHQRNEKVDFDHPPLSAPLCFPSPHRDGDGSGDPTAKAQEKRPKQRRVRSSHFDGLLGHKRGRKSTELLQSSQDLANPVLMKRSDEEVSNLRRNAKDHRPGMSTGVAPQNPSMAFRSKSLGTRPDGSNAAALTNVRAMARRFDAEPLSDANRQLYHAHHDRSARVTPRSSPGAPDLRKSSSVSTLATQSNSSRSANYTHNGPRSVNQSPISPTKIRSPKNREDWEIQLHKSRSVKQLAGSPDSKVLPPLPLIPKSKQDRVSEPVKGRISSAEKKLPLLPHQKTVTQGQISPGTSHHESTSPLLAYIQKQSQLATISSPDQGTRSSPGRETTSRHIRMQSEPPHTPVEEAYRIQPQHQQASVRPNRPRSTTHGTGQINQIENSSQHTFSTFPSEPALQQIPDRFSGGLAYNYTRTHGISSSAGSAGFANTTETKGTQSGFRKSVSMSKGFGLDLTDVPIFIYANDGPFSAHGRTEGVGSGGWF